MYGYGTNWSFWQVGLMGLGMLAVLALAAWAVYAVITNARHQDPTGPPEPSEARRHIDGRLARGEIDIDDYGRLRDALDHPDGDRAHPHGS